MTPALLLAAAFAAAPAPSALERLAGQLVEVVKAHELEGPVGVYVDGPGTPLGRATATVLMGRLAALRFAPVPVVARDADDAERVARQLGAASLLRLAVTLEGTRVVARGDAFGTRVNFWSGRTPTRTGKGLSLAATAEADAEVVTLGGAPPAPPPPRPLALEVRSFAKLPAWPGALAVSDVDGDGRAEVLALVADTLVAWSGDGAPLARAELSSARTATPARDPFGLVIASAGRVVVYSARRERPEAFGADPAGWRSLGPADSVSSGPLALTPLPGLAAFASGSTWNSQPLALPGPIVQVSWRGPHVLLVMGDGAGVVLKEPGPAGRVSGVGSGSALADLDGDGTPEVLLTSPRTIGDADQLRVVALGAFLATQARRGAATELPELLKRTLGGRAVVAAAGDLDGDGRDEVILGVWRSDGSGELLLVRGTP